MWSQLLLLLTLLCYTKTTLAIDCFKCSSFGGSNEYCEDPFHHNFSANILHAPCWAGRKNRDGIYPATACVKLKGVYGDTDQTLMIRDCALDSGSLTTDTELTRVSHCGHFVYNNRNVKGCVQSCSTDACNQATNHIEPWKGTALFLTMLSLNIASRKLLI